MNINNLFTNFKKSLQEFSIPLKILIIMSIFLGILLRFNYLDTKVYSLDETFSTTNIFGRNVAEIIDVKIVSQAELQSYQKLDNQETFPASIKRLVAKPYVFPPLYSIGMQIWARIFTNYLSQPSIINRSFSVFISLFSLGGMYWLCWELFLSHRIAWIATTLLAVSPLYLQYSQIVRTYSLITVAIVVCSAVLLRSLRQKTKKDWMFYSISVAFGLYSNILFAFTIIAHGFYIILTEKFRWSKTVKNYLIFSSIGVAMFMPWFILFLAKGVFGYSVAQPISQKEPLGVLIKNWINNIPKIFVDLNDPWIPWTHILKYPNILLRISLLLWLIFCIFYIFKKGKININIFIFSLIIGGGVLLMFRDLVTGNGFSSRLRYVLTYVVGIQLIIVYGIYLLFESKYNLHKKLSNFVLIFLILSGIFSSYIISISPTWWAFGAPDYPYIAKRINELTNPVIIYEDWGDALTMSYILKENVYSHLTRQGDKFLIDKKGQIYEKYSDIILFKSSKKLNNKLKENNYWQLNSLFEKNLYSFKIDNVWKITPIEK